MYIYYSGIGILLLLLIWTAGSYLIVRNIEKPVYSVLEKRDGYEIRMYEAYIVAETIVDGDQQTALRAGFTTIADYIFGNNTTKTSIAMTAPVLDTPASEKISMTSPVLSSNVSENARIIAFVLPSAYTLETLPIPNNPQVTLRKVPSQKVAVLSFTWYATQSRIEDKKDRLVTLLKKDEVVTTSNPQVAQYNPPLSMPLILRNEIIIPIE